MDPAAPTAVTARRNAENDRSGTQPVSQVAPQGGLKMEIGPETARTKNGDERHPGFEDQHAAAKLESEDVLLWQSNLHLPTERVELKPGESRCENCMHPTAIESNKCASCFMPMQTSNPHVINSPNDSSVIPMCAGTATAPVSSPAAPAPASGQFPEIGGGSSTAPALSNSSFRLNSISGASSAIAASESGASLDAGVVSFSELTFAFSALGFAPAAQSNALSPVSAGSAPSAAGGSGPTEIPLCIPTSSKISTGSDGETRSAAGAHSFVWPGSPFGAAAGSSFAGTAPQTSPDGSSFGAVSESGDGSSTGPAKCGSFDRGKEAPALLFVFGASNVGSPAAASGFGATVPHSDGGSRFGPADKGPSGPAFSAIKGGNSAPSLARQRKQAPKRRFAAAPRAGNMSSSGPAVGRAPEIGFGAFNASSAAPAFSFSAAAPQPGDVSGPESALKEAPAFGFGPASARSGGGSGSGPALGGVHSVGFRGFGAPSAAPAFGFGAAAPRDGGGSSSEPSFGVAPAFGFGAFRSSSTAPAFGFAAAAPRSCGRLGSESAEKKASTARFGLGAAGPQMNGRSAPGLAVGGVSAFRFGTSSAQSGNGSSVGSVDGGTPASGSGGFGVSSEAPAFGFGAAPALPGGGSGSSAPAAPSFGFGLTSAQSASGSSSGNAVGGVRGFAAAAPRSTSGASSGASRTRRTSARRSTVKESPASARRTTVKKSPAFLWGTAAPPAEGVSSLGSASGRTPGTGAAVASTRPFDGSSAGPAAGGARGSGVGGFGASAPAFGFGASAPRPGVGSSTGPAVTGAASTRTSESKVREGVRNNETRDADGVLFDVDPASEEFTDIVAAFQASMRESTIVRLQRIENHAQRRLFESKLENIKQRLGTKFDAKTCVQLLFHGTKTAETLDKIVHGDEGFIPTMAGGATGCRYGKGSYFAKNAEYSNHYASRLSTGEKQLLVAEVAVGLWTKGESTMLAPPMLPGDKSHRFNSLVDREDRPNIFVVLQHQAYPAYVVTYK